MLKEKLVGCSRRYDRCIEDCLTMVAKGLGIGIEVCKFGYNEGYTSYELKYDIHFQSKEDMLLFVEEFNSIPVLKKHQIFIDEDDVDIDGLYATILIEWCSKDESVIDFEDAFVQDYCSVYGVDVPGSVTDDIKILTGDWVNGEIGSFTVD